MNNAATMLDPFRSHGDIFEELAAAARKAATWEVGFRPANAGAFPARVVARRNELVKLEGELAALHLDSAGSDARTSAFLDMRANARLLRTGIVAATLKPQDLLKLPRIPRSDRQDEPRIAGICALYIRTVRGEFSEPTFIAFIRALQEHDPLTVFELWNVSAFLRFCLLEAIIDQAQALPKDPAADTSLLSSLMGSMRPPANTAWPPIIDPLIAIDSALNQDPAGAFTACDFQTREAYRTKVAYVARHSDCTEVQVAEHALDLAREGARLTFNDPRIHRRLSHVGYYLVDKGFPQLAARVNFHAPLADRIRFVIRNNPDDFYITGIELITIVFIAAAIFPLLPNYPVFGRVVIAFLLLILPTMQCAVDLVNNIVTAVFDPTPLPKLDFSKGISRECTTLVAVPTLLLKEKQVRELVHELEVRFLANRDPHLHFV